MYNVNQNALDEITNIFNKQRWMNVGELTANYNQKELSVLIETAHYVSHIIDEGAKQGVLTDHFQSIGHAIKFKVWVESQNIFFKRAFLYNEGAMSFTFKTIEQDILEGVFHQN